MWFNDLKDWFNFDLFEFSSEKLNVTKSNINFILLNKDIWWQMYMIYIFYITNVNEEISDTKIWEKLRNFKK